MASEVTKRLRDRRLNVWEQCKALADGAATENRAFTAEEQGKWDVLNEEMDTLSSVPLRPTPRSTGSTPTPRARSWRRTPFTSS